MTDVHLNCDAQVVEFVAAVLDLSTDEAAARVFILNEKALQIRNEKFSKKIKDKKRIPQRTTIKIPLIKDRPYELCFVIYQYQKEPNTDIFCNCKVVCRTGAIRSYGRGYENAIKSIYTKEFDDVYLKNETQI